MGHFINNAQGGKTAHWMMQSQWRLWQLQLKTWRSCACVRYFPSVRRLELTPSGHAEMRDCSPMRCWRVTHFCVFLHFVLHMRLASDLARLSLQVYRQLDAGCWVSSYKQTDQSWPPVYRTIRLQQRDHSLRHFLFSFSCNHGCA
jgi:hypothetical protein